MASIKYISGFLDADGCISLNRRGADAVNI